MSDTKGITVDIYKHSGNSFSNGGVSERTNEVTLITEHAQYGARVEATESAPAVKLVVRHFGKRTYVHAEPVAPSPEGTVGYMDGGTYIDVRAIDMEALAGIEVFGPIPFHDRTESVAEYASLSR